jgi:lauroyl/myristoyl acyltransferase
VLRAIQKEGAGFVNLPDMDFGTKDAAFVPFFGVPAATLRRRAWPSPCTCWCSPSS